jgi:DHA1 family bicyclomycin/chloramphenicol resistance-like MFS transporter
MQIKLPFFTLLLLISFASVNAVLFTPALPNITHFFSITEDAAQQTITWFLVGYAVGQLLYGPLANRFGRKTALYAGISLQIVSSLLCVLSGMTHAYWLLIIARFMLALGAGVGLKMTFTLVHECYDPKVASQKISYLMLAFAITPGLGVALGGFLNAYWGWMSCFYAGALYGLILLGLVTRLPETQSTPNLNALKLNHLLHDYGVQFKNSRLIMGGLLMGATTCFIYVFAALAPFIAINIFHMSSEAYGTANCMPPIGLILGSLVSARLAKEHAFESIIRAGIWITGIGVVFMLTAMWMNFMPLFSLFTPMIVIYFGLCFILANASAIAMSGITDKAHGAAVMSFINMGLATLVVFSLSLFPIKVLLLPLVYLVLSIAMLEILRWLILIPPQTITSIDSAE